MAPRKDPYRNRIESIKSDLRSLSTCSTSTLQEVQDLLANKAEAADEKENARGKKAQSTAQARLGKQSNFTASRKATTTTECAGQSPRERYILATEVANITLKLLSDALKVDRSSKNTKQASTATDDARSSSQPRRTLARSPSNSTLPLGERSVSQVVNSPTKPSLRPSTSSSSCTTPGRDTGLVETAECARLAFGYLRSAEAENAGGKEAPALQLENGLLAFIGKLLAHGLDNLAVKELRILRKRIDLYLGHDANAPDKPSIQPRPGLAKRQPSTEREGLASLLDFGKLDLESAALPLVVNFQSYVLRLIARIRRPKLVEETWTSLKLANPSSPANLLFHMAKVCNKDPKIPRQLESLAHTVLSLCPSISRSEDVSERQKNLQPSPEIVFSLQHLAFKIRQRWWKLANHQINEEKELLEPFGKCMATFARRSFLSATKTYRVAELLFTDLIGTSDHLAKLQHEGSSRAAEMISRTLSSLAQSAELPEEALRWLGGSGCTIDSRESPAAAAMKVVQSAALALELFVKKSGGSTPGDVLSSASETLSGDLSGSTSELDSLFMQANVLRRTASKALSKGYQVIERVPELRETVLAAILASMRFTARFLATSTNSNPDPQDQVRLEKRTSLVSTYSQSIVESACICSKLPVMQNAKDYFSLIDELLQNCAAIMYHFQDDAGALKEDPQQPFVKLSNAYWAAHLQLKLAEGTGSLSLRAMQRSVDLLKGKPHAEQRAGLLTMKLEKFAETLEAGDRIEEAKKIIVKCIETNIDFGALQTAIDLAQTQPLHLLFDGDELTTSLGRVLKTYQRTFLKHGFTDKAELCLFDESSLPPAGRGLLLEYQLAMYMKVLSRNRTWDHSFNDSLRVITERLQELYTPTQYPIRRRRVQLVVLQLSSERPDILPCHIARWTDSSDEKQACQGTEDEGLSRFHTHFKALLKAKLCVQRASPCIADVQKCYSLWNAMIDGAGSWKALCNQVNDVELWLADLQTLADYLVVKGEEYSCLPLLHLVVKVLELKNDKDPSRLVSSLCTLGSQLLRLGYTGKAGEVLSKAENLNSSPHTSTEAKLQWHLAHAEFLVQIGNTTQCQDSLTTAESIARADEEFMGLADSSTTLSGRVRFNRILADAYYIHSMLAGHTGNHKEAARHAKQCVSLNRRIWAALENKAASTTTAGVESGSSNMAFDPLSSIRNEKGQPLITSLTHAALDGPSFWPLVPRLYQGLMLQSSVYAQQGLLQEAVYVAEQAGKVATAVNARSLVVDNASRRAEYWVHGGRSDKARTTLALAEGCLPHQHVFAAGYHSALARICHSDEQYDEELAAYDTLESSLKELSSPSFIKSLGSLSSGIDDLTEGMAKVSLAKEGPAKKVTAKQTRVRKPAAPKVTKPAGRAPRKAPGKAAQTDRASTVNTAEDCLAIATLRAEVERRKALVKLMQEEVSEAFELLSHAQSLEKGGEPSLSQHWISFKAGLVKSMELIEANLDFNTLPESTIAFPAVRPKQAKPSPAVVPKRAKSTSSKGGRGAKGKQPAKKDFIATLLEARERLVQAHQVSARIGSSASFQQISSSLAHVTVLLSAVSNGDFEGSVHPLYSAYMSEIPKVKSLRLAQEIIEVEQEKLLREQYLSWPTLASPNQDGLCDASNFQKDYVDIIPETWTAISLALNEDQDELYITRYEAGHSPFVLRLPMARHSSRDLDEEAFSFEDGKRDLEEIIELSDFSTRSAKDMMSREAKVQWWAEREALDARLHELLINIENIWLGGFKGIFSQVPRDAHHLSHFRRTFESILDKHLPSRQGRTPQAKVALDPRVMDLFVGLGDATDDQLDLDEALMDLIYFVLDILQFNGERNAVDEVDVDSMVIETLDALHAYHGACKMSSRETTHTILILDKKLHMFPWESMPCLQSLAVSRLPSLQALRDRVLAARPSSVAAAERPGHHISTDAGGTSILNPSGDLTHTLNTLKPRLAQMQGSWKHITTRPPSEEEFESALKDQEVVLYFGHGSGAQFIKSKTVRRLYLGNGCSKSGCATTLLFGCSSVHLTENGIYEPSGMLASYLTAGAPAVVGMLWDVTDKDCDRMAVKAGELWGLWPESKEENEAPKTARKTKGKTKIVAGEGARATRTPAKSKGRKKADDEAHRSQSPEGGRRGLGLDEAVQKARKTCVLPYLNGAAAVVYGIPVFLE
ncbi:hypothetical protein M011DRAFT_467584 [Sporormia fimetaria CBS 119925]|uniref:separase n=1 Tax=Sporormia fimetaria CBS 119925 TaxID=1340428 RepID=A0A6A6VEC1_9PLEO|nr:hypothetical protein M011DRAFT_467584 [Sporormia fimetaria CBS 119925]